MNEALFESLLFEKESETLDFKREQYRFVGASDDEKSELRRCTNPWAAGVSEGNKRLFDARLRSIDAINALRTYLNL